MNTVYKYDLELKEEQVLSLPADAEILSIQEQGGNLCAWVSVDTEKPERDKTIIISGTGNAIYYKDLRHITTLQMGSMVWHFFEL